MRVHVVGTDRELVSGSDYVWKRTRIHEGMQIFEETPLHEVGTNRVPASSVVSSYRAEVLMVASIDVGMDRELESGVSTRETDGRRCGLTRACRSL